MGAAVTLRQFPAARFSVPGRTIGQPCGAGQERFHVQDGAEKNGIVPVKTDETGGVARAFAGVTKHSKEMRKWLKHIS
jgi:hypothetical protein